MVLNGASTCSNTCASTCITTHASTCITTRASTCHYTRARLLFKNMRPGVFTLNDSLTLEYVPTAQNKQFCASWKLKLETNATFPSLPSSLLSQMGLGNGSQKCFFNFPFLLMKQVWTQWTLRKSFPCSLWTRICFSKPLDGEALVGGAGMFISGRRSPWKGARGLKGAYSQSTKYNPTEESWLDQPRFTHQGKTAKDQTCNLPQDWEWFSKQRCRPSARRAAGPSLLQRRRWLGAFDGTRPALNAVSEVVIYFKELFSTFVL